MKQIILTLCLLLGFSIQTNAQSVELDIADYKLDNGLRIIVIPDHRAPVVTHMIWYKVGSADDPPGKSGIAHFLEHLMFKGTSNNAKGVFGNAIAEIGGQENAFTSYDYTSYYQKVSPDALGQMMAFEADRMRNLVLSEEVVLPERQVILEERSSRVDNNPSAILSEFTQAALFVHHPYGIPIIGWEHEIETLSREDALEFYEHWYQPWNATVVVAGDVEAEEVLRLASLTYGKVKETRPFHERRRLDDPKPAVSKEISYRHPRVTQPVFRELFSTPSYQTASGNDAEALDLLGTILGDSVSSRLYSELVLEQKLATSTGAYFFGSAREGSYFTVYGTPRGEHDIKDVENAIRAQIAKLRENGITQEELDRARRTYLKGLVFSQDSQVSMARIFGSILSRDGTIEDYTKWPERLGQVTVDDVNRVARQYLNHDISVKSYLLPEVSQ